MRFPWTAPASPSKASRRSQRMGFTWDSLEQRAVLSRMGGFHPMHSVAQDASTSGTATAAVSHFNSGSGSSSSSNSALNAAQQMLQSDVQAIRSNSGTTVGELTRIQVASQTLR